MDKSFWEALHDNFSHVEQISDPEHLKKLREDGVLVDDEGYYFFSPHSHPELELCIEPLGEDAQGDHLFYIAFYQNRVPLFQKLKIWVKKKE